VTTLAPVGESPPSTESNVTTADPASAEAGATFGAMVDEAIAGLNPSRDDDGASASPIRAWTTAATTPMTTDRRHAARRPRSGRDADRRARAATPPTSGGRIGGLCPGPLLRRRRSGRTGRP
jgi:hypothetical protein